MKIQTIAAVSLFFVLLAGCESQDEELLVADAVQPATATETAASGAAAPAPAFPCEDGQKFRQFDFWIGEWEVHDATGQYAGRNVIEPAHHGCVLVENWTSASGGTGMSINYHDHATGEWVQVWIDSGGGQIEIRGGLSDDGMLLTGRIHYTANGTTAPFRGLWTPLPDGRVRQFFEQSNDGGETWQTWFEGFYSRLAEQDNTGSEQNMMNRTTQGANRT